MKGLKSKNFYLIDNTCNVTDVVKRKHYANQGTEHHC
jgi:hypothetical protein